MSDTASECVRVGLSSHESDPLAETRAAVDHLPGSLQA
jgi:hypothetical protein